MIAAIEMRGPKLVAPPERVNLGVVISVAFHAALIGCLLVLVHPHVPFTTPVLPRVTVTLLPPARLPTPRIKPPPQRTTLPPKSIAPPQEIVPQVPSTTTPDQAATPAQPVDAAPQAPARVLANAVPSSYYNMLEAIIQKSVRYPAKSIAHQEEGDCQVKVTFARDGSIEGSQLIQQAGFPALEGECREVFKRISRFPPVPADVSPDATDFSIELPINFNLVD